MGACVAVMLFCRSRAASNRGWSFTCWAARRFALMAGPWLALIGLAIVLAGVTAYGMAGGRRLASIFGDGRRAVAVTGSHLRLAQRLPANYFVYIFQRLPDRLAELFVPACSASACWRWPTPMRRTICLATR